ncbi:MAG TPA: cation diffusion facilitator family transporter [Prolixibacteraceae bacterium]|nr:cation diffusion facilitator family transporter [Prolixibacteraceae bacterium]
MAKSSLRKYVYLSIAAAVTTIAIKITAYFLTNSVGLLSDGLESCVNLVAAVVALFLLTLSEKPADEEHAFGHSKAEYFSSAIEGGLIVVAAVAIIWSALPRLVDPLPVENVGIGILVATGASVINMLVALVLIRNGRKHHSITLEADGKHLMTDVITSAGVLIGVGLVQLTGWLILDPIVAIGVALNIVWTGYQLMKRSAMGLMDTSIPEEEEKYVRGIIDRFKGEKIGFHALKTRQAGQRKFISFHLLVPDEWSIKQGHDLSENIEQEIRNLFPGSLVTVFTHMEPAGDPVSHKDIPIDRN